VVAVGVCANATLASNAEPAKPAMVYLANISVLLSSKKDTEKTRHLDNGSKGTCDQKPPQCGGTKSLKHQ
jgi:hypothetical protein